jgi:hypothetical protein
MRKKKRKEKSGLGLLGCHPSIQNPPTTTHHHYYDYEQL